MKHSFMTAIVAFGLAGFGILTPGAASAQVGRYTTDVPLTTVEVDCINNVQEACLVAFLRYHQGTGVAANPVKAEFYMKRSCLTGSGIACAAYATILENKPASKSAAGRAEVVKYADMGCNLGEQDSCKQSARLKAVAVPAKAQTNTPPKSAVVAATPKPLPKPAPKPAPMGMADHCNAGDAYACEKHAWDLGNTGAWPGAAQWAKKGCALGRDTSCSAAGIYDRNANKFGDQSDAGKQAKSDAVIDRAQKSGNYAQEIRWQLTGERHLVTAGRLVELGGPQTLRQLSFDEVGDLAGQPWGAEFALANRYVQAEWRLRDGPAILARRKAVAERAANAARQPQPKIFQGVGDNETGTASCYVSGRAGKRYQYRGADGNMIYGGCY